MGRLVAACTNDTIKGFELRLVISQPAAAPYIQAPMFATTVAIQSNLKTLLRKGVQSELTAVSDLLWLAS
jgi:hypothetical protein